MSEDILIKKEKTVDLRWYIHGGKRELQQKWLYSHINKYNRYIESIEEKWLPIIEVEEVDT